MQQRIFTILKRDPYLLVICALCSIIISGSIVYYFFNLGYPQVFTALILASALFTVSAKTLSSDDKDGVASSNPGRPIKPYAYLAIYLSAITGCFLTVANQTTGDSLVSPWERIPAYFFALYGLSSGLLLIYLFKAESAGLRGYRLMWPLSLHLFFMLSIGSIFFLIGNGYDPFVHEAGIKHIIEYGNLVPKTIYYLGQYSLFAIIGKTLFIKPWILNKYFIQLTTALLLPEAMRRALGRDSKNPATIASIILLCLPLFFLTITTPQNIAYLFVMLLILLNTEKDKRKSNLGLSSLLSAASFLLQPIAGIPAILFTLYIALDESKKSGFAKYLIFLPATAVIPAILFIISPEKNLHLSLDYFAVLGYFNLSLPHTEGITLDFAYLFIRNFAFVFCSLAVAGAFRNLKKKQAVLLPFFLMASSQFFSYMIAETLPFDYLINYERSNYSIRLLLMAVLFALPLVFGPVKILAQKLFFEERLVKICFIFMLMATATASLYTSYPRKDDYFDSKSYSIGSADIEAVQAIEKDAMGEPYIVLSNQQVSAASLREFGFKTYYENKLCANDKNPVLELDGAVAYSIDCSNAFLKDIFYYPVPTGGPLYQFYLSMVYGYPKKETMKKAMEMAGVQKGYFVLNKYWWASSKIGDEAKLEAKSWKEFGNGQVLVFSF